ncbi:hypothetical protein [Pseudofrankia sp. DC12]|uniref:hypothetical protein n=1 Tax=Pseudofrankia sp. DC12 TaxID=683315 RepID=UPI000A9936D9|nr:hypothetical protein [Pseudofrankia sp. DC12]
MLRGSSRGWRSWRTAVLTIWAATLYDSLATAHTLPAAVPFSPDAARLRDRPARAMAALDVLTREFRRHGAEVALIALSRQARHRGHRPKPGEAAPTP